MALFVDHWKAKGVEPAQQLFKGKVCVFGATGAIGYTLCECLCLNKIPLVAAYKPSTRNAERIQKLQDLRKTYGQNMVTLTEMDWMKPDTIVSCLQGVERVFLKTPIGHVDDCTKAFLDCITAKNLSNLHMVCFFSAFDAREPTEKIGAFENPVIQAENLPKYKLGRDLYYAERRLRQCNIPWCIVRPSFLFSNFRFDIPMIQQKSEICRPLGLVSFNIVSDSDVAQCVCSILGVLDTRHHNSKTYHLTGPSLYNMNDVAVKFSVLLGKQVTYKDVSESDYRSILEKLGKFDREGIDAYLSCHQCIKEKNYDWIDADCENMIHTKPMNLETMLQYNKELFQ